MKKSRGRDSASHLPVLQACIEFFDPQLFVEFGIGPHSTSMLWGSQIPKVVSLEADPRWYRKLIHLKPERHELHLTKAAMRISGFTEPDAISPRLRRWLNKRYNRVLKTLENIDIAFIDGLQFERIPALELVQFKAKVLVAHDSDPNNGFKKKGDRWIPDNGIHRWKPDFPHTRISCRTVIPWTDIFIRHDIQFDEKTLIDKLNTHFAARYPDADSDLVVLERP